MRIVLSLVKRNLRIYRRDRAGVLLSLLAALMLLLIYALFLGAIQADSLKAKLPSAASEDVGYFVASWVFGGIVMITCVTTGLGALGAYVDDRATGRFKEFRVCPIRRHQLILGYQLSAVVVSFVMTLIVSAVGAAVVKLVYGDIPGWGSFLTALGYVVLFAFAFSAISSFVITFISSRNGFTALSTIVGTLLGFLAGAYLPVGALSGTVVNGINVLPYSPAVVLLREPLAGDALDRVTGGVQQARESIGEYYGFTLDIGGTSVSTPWILAAFVGLTVVFTALGTYRIGKTIK